MGRKVPESHQGLPEAWSPSPPQAQPAKNLLFGGFQKLQHEFSGTSWKFSCETPHLVLMCDHPWPWAPSFSTTLSVDVLVEPATFHFQHNTS
jgi:hypothetical protein